MPTSTKSRRFRLILVKPSHYDDDGYVIQWLRSSIPSNSLAALCGIARDCAERRVLGPDVEIGIDALDETNTRIRPKRLASKLAAAGRGMVMLVGVQSNQFPRALDLARSLRAYGVQVCIGGFHVSGVTSMLGGVDAGLDEARALGVSLYAGEAEGRLEEVLQDADGGRLKPFYDAMSELPVMTGAPIPLIELARAQRTIGKATSFDAGRGCPYQCSFCTIINVQGRTSRHRSPDDIERIVRANYAQGLKSFFITDDNFARNKNWEAILDRLIWLREVEKIDLGLIIQVDTLCHRLPNFIAKCGRAGVRRVFIGLENINPENLLEAKKRQNKITEYREMLMAWKAVRVITYAGYILGFPADTPQSILHDIDVIKRELPVDLLEFFILTPLPGSEDHQKLVRAGAPLDPDLNNYDTNHVCTTHPKMTAEAWREVYLQAWRRYYSTDHVTTILKRVAACGGNASNALFFITWFKGSIDFEHVHPLESGLLRLKSRRDRRPGFAREPLWVFYPSYLSSVVVKTIRWAALYLRLRRIYLRIKRDPQRHSYTDVAMCRTEEAGELELFASEAAQTYVGRQRKMLEIRQGRAAAASR